MIAKLAKVHFRTVEDVRLLAAIAMEAPSCPGNFEADPEVCRVVGELLGSAAYEKDHAKFLVWRVQYALTLLIVAGRLDGDPVFFSVPTP